MRTVRFFENAATGQSCIWTTLRAAVCLIVLTIAAVGPASADSAARFDAWRAAAEAAEAALDAPYDGTTLETMRADVEADRAEARLLNEAAAADAAPFEAQLAQLGDAADGEDPAVTAERDRLQEALATPHGLRVRAAAAFERADGLLTRIQDAQRAQLSKRLSTRSPSPLLPASLAQAAQDLGATVSTAVTALAAPGIVAFLALVALAAAAIFTAQRLLTARLAPRLRAALNFAAERPLIRLGVATAAAVGRFAPFAILAFIVQAGARWSGAFDVAGLEIIDVAALSALFLVGANTAAHIIFAPHEPRLRVLSDTDAHAHSAARVLTAFGALYAVDQVLDVIGARHGWSPAGFGVVNLAFVLIGSLLLQRLTVLAAPAPSDSGANDDDEATLSVLARFMRVAAGVLAVILPIAAAVGYYELSRFILQRVALSAVSLALALALYAALRELARAAAIRLSGAQHSEGGGWWLSSLVGVAMLTVVGAVLALIWGASVSDLRAALRTASEGIQIGDRAVTPGDLLFALGALIVGVAATRLLQRLLRRTVLPRTRLDTGARNSLVTGIGYAGVIAAILWAVSAAGLNLSNLAIIAGALSVGIGFGLQTIVNNFVSGLILLIERPIKVGDWVQVNGTHGYVKKINVRSTHIETFNRTDVMVPNANLISNSVENYTLSNKFGRVIVPVSVDYGADPEHVRRVLLELAKAHEIVMSYPAPGVVFRAFGDSALDFEVRAHIRDVNWSLTVKSDLNFAIAKRFAEEGIGFPYPQRDLHIRSLPEGFPGRSGS